MTDPTSIPCGRCEAAIGDACRTITGKRATYSHSARTQPLWAAFNEGYEEGERGGLDAGLNRPEYARRLLDRYEAE